MPLPANSPANSTAIPPIVSTPPITSRTRRRGGRSIATSRIAAIGGTRAAWRAGNTAEKTVINVPTSMPVTIAEVGNTIPAAGMSKPNAASTAFRPSASNTPPATPTADATMPTTTDSPITAASTCRRLAPIARNNAISRLRCATTIENVL